MKIKRYILSCALLVILISGACYLIYARKDAPPWYQESRELYYGIPVHVSFSPENPALSERVWAYLESINDVFNDYRDGSEIFGINRLNAAGDVTLSPMLTDAFEKARQMWTLSEGVFDVTCAPIRNLWKEAGREDRLPSDEEVAAVLARCGLNRTKQEGNRLSISTAGMKFDFGGIVKGIIADHVIAMLKEGGVQSALVQIGGETAAYGVSRKNRPFRIGIQHPVFRDGMWGVIQDSGNGISTSTSGNYENPILIDDEEFYHIMDPRTGRPAKTQILSVTIAFPETGLNWMADSFSTAGVLLGPEKTFEIIKPFGGEAMFLIKQNGEIQEIDSEGWGKFQ